MCFEHHCKCKLQYFIYGAVNCRVNAVCTQITMTTWHLESISSYIFYFAEDTHIEYHCNISGCHVKGIESALMSFKLFCFQFSWQYLNSIYYIQSKFYTLPHCCSPIHQCDCKSCLADFFCCLIIWQFGATSVLIIEHSWSSIERFRANRSNMVRDSS